MKLTEDGLYIISCPSCSSKDMIKKSYKGSILGESNNIYVDSYGISKVSGSNTLRDLGAIYRNNIYICVVINMDVPCHDKSFDYLIPTLVLKYSG